MFENLGPGKLQLFVEPPPRGIFTYEDEVKGKVTFDLTKTYPLGYVYIYFHGWVITETVNHTQNYQNSQGPYTTYAKDKEVLFQYELKIFQANGHEKSQKGTHYDWPFRFNFFHPDVRDATALPTSGKHGTSSVEYKISVSCAPWTLDETSFRRHRNPDDVLNLKEAPINFDKFRGSLEKLVGSGAEQDLQFLQIRPQKYVGGDMAGPFKVDLDIARHHLPQLGPDSAPPGPHGLLHRSNPSVPFSVTLDLPKHLVQGAPFPIYLSVASWNQEWTDRPPLVQLTSLKVKLIMRTISRASLQHSEADRNQVVFDVKNLGVALGPEAVDVGRLFAVTIFEGEGIVPSFSTRLLEQSYFLPIECGIEVAGKSFKVDYPIQKGIELYSSMFAVGGQTMAPPEPPFQKEKQKEMEWDGAMPQSSTFSEPQIPLAMGIKSERKIRINHTYIGRLTQDSEGPVRYDSVMEVALKLCRVFTLVSIQLEWTGGATFKIVPYTPPRGLNDRNYDHRLNEKDELKAFMADQFGFYNAPEFWDIYSQYTELLHLQKFIIKIPHVVGLQNNDHFMKKWLSENEDRTDSVQVNPITMLNYLLQCAVERPGQEFELSDFQMLSDAFGHHLKHHKKQIDINTARIANEMYPMIGEVLTNLGLDMRVSQKAAPAPAQPRDRSQNSTQIDGEEEKLVKGFKGLLHRYHN